MSIEGTNAYPYPIHDWQDPALYPEPMALDGPGWAWEFLRRNPEYQRLWDLFASMPDAVDIPDGRGGVISDVKCGKWKGTPWADFRFLTDGAGWYAEPEPRLGEDIDAYDARCPDGEVMPFADYLASRFRLDPQPIDPRGAWSNAWFGNQDYDPRAVEPFVLGLDDAPITEGLPTSEADKRAAGWAQRFYELGNNPNKLAVVFDLQHPMDAQIEFVRELLQDHACRRGVQDQRSLWPVYLQILDGRASQASWAEIARTLYAGQDGAKDRVRAQYRRACELAERDYYYLSIIGASK